MNTDFADFYTVSPISGGEESSTASLYEKGRVAVPVQPDELPAWFVPVRIYGVEGFLSARNEAPTQSSGFAWSEAAMSRMEMMMGRILRILSSESEANAALGTRCQHEIPGSIRLSHREEELHQVGIICQAE